LFNTTTIMHIELTDDATAFRARDWTALAEADPAGTFFHTPGYLKLYWEEFGTGALRLAFAVEDGVDVGVAAFEIVERELRFLGGFDVTDYLGPVALPDARERVAKELAAALAASGGWDRADLRGLAEDSAWFETLHEAFGSAGLKVERGDDGVAPNLDLPPTYDEYLASLPSKRRHEIRRKERRLAERPGGYEVRIATPATLEDDLHHFLELHRSSLGPKGRFMHAGMEIFFRRLAEAFLAPHVFHLAFLEVDGVRAAGAIGFAWKNTFSLYNSAFDRSFAELSPGMILVADLIRRSIEAGRGRFDLLKGDLDYKYRFSPVPRPVRSLLVERP
jgi:CelD/BcsL family acetyltransferase involved in cellulose biosynthesis